MWPSRSLEAPRFAALPARPNSGTGSVTFAYAGTINSEGYASALRQLASSLQESGAQLLLFGPFTPEDARRMGLDLPSVTCRGLIHPSELLATLRSEADVLYVPMSFDRYDEPNMKAGFPSKLVDYTATGLPILIHAPRYSSAAQWAATNQDAALVVDTPDADSLNQAVRKLIGDPALRSRLAANALRAGAQFSHENVYAHFTSLLKSHEQR